MMRLPTTLDDRTEEIVRRVIGCCITVHKALGPRFVEPVYNKAVGLELEAASLAFEREKPYPVTFRGKRLYLHRLDLVVEDCVMVELKAVDRLHPVHRAQCLSGLQISKLRICLLINFNVDYLPTGLRRIVL
jgi:GxxExxY protein